MSIIPVTSGRTNRPLTASLTVGVLLFLGVSALGGGLAMVIGYTPPQQWLDAIPLVNSWIIPGLVLGLGFGAGSLVVARGVAFRPRWRCTERIERATRHHWSWAGTLVIGIGQVAWIVLELIYLPEASVLQAVYGATGLALLALPLMPSTSRYLASRVEAGAKR
jgi:hypothetical protein